MDKFIWVNVSADKDIHAGGFVTFEGRECRVYVVLTQSGRALLKVL